MTPNVGLVGLPVKVEGEVGGEEREGWCAQ